MRAISIISMALVLTISTTAFAEEASNKLRYSATAEIGYVVLTDPAEDTLDNAMGYGVTVSYHLRPFLRAELPILASFHEGKDLSKDEDAEMSMISLTPGLAFGSTGRLRLWMFFGAGATMVRSKFEIGRDSTEDEDIAFATNFRTGLDLYWSKNLSIGFAVGVMTAALDAERLNQSSKWQTNTYYTLMGRVGYLF